MCGSEPDGQGDIVNLLHGGARRKRRSMLVADIHRGGVFAQIVGYPGMPAHRKTENADCKGFVINRFHGDIQNYLNPVWTGSKKKPENPVYRGTALV